MSTEYSYDACVTETPKNKRVGKNTHMSLVGKSSTISISDIELHEEQARSYMNDKNLNSLKRSIETEGLLHPLIVWEKKKSLIGKKYVLMSGHRRLRAMKELGYKTTDVMIHKDMIGAKCAAVSANHHVENIHPIDKGVEIASLWKMGVFDRKEELAEYLDISKSLLYRYLGYSLIPESTRAMIVKNEIRNKTFLKDVAKTCKDMSKKKKRESLSDEEVAFILEEKVECLMTPFIEGRRETDRSDKVESKVEGFKNTRILFLENGIAQISKRKIESLSLSQKEDLKDKIEEILQLI